MPSASGSTRLRFGIFLALFLALWYSDFVSATCNSPPKIWIDDKTLECQYDGPNGPDPKYSGVPGTKPSDYCRWCYPSTPTYTDQVVGSGSSSTDNPSTCPYPKVIERTWTTKACDISASVCQKITIVDTTPPYFVCSDTKFQVQCGDDYSPDTLGYPDVYDKCDQHVKLTYQDEETYGDCPVVKIVKRVWTATDDCGNKSYFIQWIYISDSKGPAWKWFPDDCYRDCKETCSVNDCGTPKAYDSCSQVQVYVDKEYDVPNPDGCGKTTIRVWVAKDACGLNITRNQKIVIKDKTLPYWVSFPDNYTLGCKDDTSPSKCGYPKANDDCSGVCDISYKDYNFDGKCPYAKTIKRVWTAKDKCGNAITKTQYIYINDIKAPYFKDIKNQTLEW
jgi:hypothetical protein